MNVLKLTDEELEDCVDGSTNIEMIREIFGKPGVIVDSGFINVLEFANWFSYGLRGYIDVDADVDMPLWLEFNSANEEWGIDIANNINKYISGQ